MRRSLLSLTSTKSQLPSCCCCPSCLCCCPSCLCSCSSCCCHLCCCPSCRCCPSCQLCHSHLCCCSSCCCFSLRILPEDMYKQDINFIQRRYLRHAVLKCDKGFHRPLIIQTT